MAVTRLGLSGFARPPYASFAGKTETEVDSGAGASAKFYLDMPDGSRILGTREQLEEVLALQQRQEAAAVKAAPVAPTLYTDPDDDAEEFLIDVGESLTDFLARMEEEKIERIRLRQERDAIIALILAA